MEFHPALFRFELATSPDVRDVKGREVSLPVAMPSSDQEVERREQASVSKDEALLKAMASKPGATINDWAVAAKIHKEAAKRALSRLAKPANGKLVQNVLRKWSLTPAGHKAVGGLMPQATKGRHPNFEGAAKPHCSPELSPDPNFSETPGNTGGSPELSPETTV
jgi:hypothetical protein